MATAFKAKEFTITLIFIIMIGCRFQPRKLSALLQAVRSAQKTPMSMTPGRALLKRQQKIPPFQKTIAVPANNSLHFNDEDEEEGEVKSNAPVRSNNAEGNDDRIDNKDSGSITEVEQSAFQ